MPTVEIAEWPEEFLIRTRPPSMKDDDDKGGWHIRIGSEWTSPDGKINRTVSGPLTPEQALKRGWTPEKIVEALDLAIMQRADALHQQNHDMVATIEQLGADVAARDRAIVALRDEAAALREERDAAFGQRDAVTAMLENATPAPAPEEAK